MKSVIKNMFNTTIREYLKENQEKTLLEFSWELFVRLFLVALALVVAGGLTIEAMRLLIG